MTIHVLTMATTALVMWTVAFPHAQQPSTPKEPAHKTLRLTGCLEAGADATTFKLVGASANQRPITNVSPAHLPAPDAAGTAGETRDYELKPDPDLDLKLSTHIGHHVEISARPVEPAPPTPTRSTQVGRAEPVTPEPALNEPKLERLTVIAITDLSSTCR